MGLPDSFRQVRGYVFNQNGEVLIVQAVDKTWGIVGGTKERNETPLDTFSREVTEEANVTIHCPEYLGAVEVNAAEGAVYFQLRYAALLKEENQFEVNPNDMIARRWIPVCEISNYIPWTARSPIYAEEIKAALAAYKKLSS